MITFAVHWLSFYCLTEMENDGTQRIMVSTLTVLHSGECNGLLRIILGAVPYRMIKKQCVLLVYFCTIFIINK